MILQPDCWLSENYDKSFGPRGQWRALRRLYTDMPLVGEDSDWLLQTTVDEVDGKMADLLEKWLGENLPKKPTIEDSPLAKSVVKNSETSLSKPEERSTANVIGDLFADIGNEIEQIKTGQLSTEKANEIAKFRTMQIRSMELVLQAGHLEVKARGLKG